MTPEQEERLIAALEKIAATLARPISVEHSWPILGGYPPPQMTKPFHAEPQPWQPYWGQAS